jgi:DNA-binding transcriptional regulator YiaG
MTNIPRRRPKPRKRGRPAGPRSRSLAAEQFRATLDALDLSQRDGARFLNINERTLRRWALGERPVDAFMNKVLRYMLAHNLKPRDLDPQWQT